MRGSLRLRHLSLSQVLAGMVILAGVMVLPVLIQNEKWFYLVGLALGGFFGLILVAGQWELGIICCLAAALIVEVVFFGYWTLYDVYIVGVSDAMLFTLCVAYLSRKIVSRRATGDNSSNKGALLDVADALFLFFAACLFGTALSTQYEPGVPNPAFSYFLQFGLRGGMTFTVAWRILSEASPRGIRLFIIGLILVGAILSFAQSSDIILGTSFLNLRIVPDTPRLQAIADAPYLARSAFAVRSFIPYASRAVTAGAIMIPFLSVGLVFLLSPKKHLLIRLLCGSIVASEAINLFSYMLRAVWLGALVAIAMVLFFQQRRVRNVLLLVGLGLLLLFLASVMINVGTFQIHLPEPTQFISDLPASHRWLLWTKTLQALPSFPLLFGEGLNNGYMYAKTLGQSSVQAYSYSPTYWFEEYGYPHNAYLHLLVGAGIPAFLAFVGLLGWVYKETLSALMWRATRGREALIALFAACISLSVMMFFQEWMWAREANFYFCLLLGAMLGLAKNRMRTERPILPISSESKVLTC